ncbi:hypothetical protein GGD63_006964 [Bradyrhizobium sp. cir1]|uniref:ribbon-helix-helix domain-containing protein n=1 Tax=Bradyrhizobium sp. cir1 TaxID=1445730 RepID=UPI001606C6DD|nr:ribbon-helix-helix domain-containing protein [Bradyrhizobium sp. cir1]MBB4374135.1 hypothetical protein [Bradyrhizobium sp. cir1]
MNTSKGPLSAALAVRLVPETEDGFGPPMAAESQSDDRCGILVRVTKEMRRDLKLAAIDRGTTVQDLMLEAITVVLASAPRPGP